MIIDEILNEIQLEEEFEKLVFVCNKMKKENDYVIKRLETPEILYYNKCFENDFFQNYLLLVSDLLNETYMVEKVQFKKTDDMNFDEYRKLSSIQIKQRDTKRILYKYATVLKKLIRRE